MRSQIFESSFPQPGTRACIPSTHLVTLSEEIGRCKSFSFSDVGDMHVVVFKQENNNNKKETQQQQQQNKSFLLQYIKVLRDVMDITERAVDDSDDPFKVLIRHKDPRF